MIMLQLYALPNLRPWLTTSSRVTNHYQLYDCEYSSVVDRLRSLAKQFTTKIFTTDVKLKAGAAKVNTINF